MNKKSVVKLEIFSILIILSVIAYFLIASLPLGKSEHAYVLNGSSVYIDNTHAFISATPHTRNSSGYINYELESKDYTGNIDVYFGFDSSTGIKPKSLELYNPHEVNTTLSYVCSNPYYFNYTLSPKQAWCWENITYWKDNLTEANYMHLVFEHDFETGNLGTGTIYWNESELVEWTDIGDTFIQVPYDYGGKDIWYVRQNIPITAGQRYTVRAYIDVPIKLGYVSGKYDVAIKPSSLSISEAISQDKFYILDPWYINSFLKCWNWTVQGSVDDPSFRPLLILNDTNVNYSDFIDEGEDLRFTNNGTNTTIPHWIRLWNTSGNSFVYVNVTETCADMTECHFTMYGNNTGIEQGSDFNTTFPDVVVWYGFEDNDNYSYTNPSYQLKGNGGRIDREGDAGVIGSAVNFSGDDASDKLVCNATFSEAFYDFNTTSKWTVSLWVKPFEYKDAYDWYYTIGQDIMGEWVSAIAQDVSPGDTQSFTESTGGDRWNFNNTGKWDLYSMKHDGTDFHGNINGTEFWTETKPPHPDSTNALAIAGQNTYDANRQTYAYIDEFMIFNRTLSDNYLKLLHTPPTTTIGPMTPYVSPNTAPDIIDMAINSTIVYTNNNLECFWNVSDADGDSLTVRSFYFNSSDPVATAINTTTGNGSAVLLSGNTTKGFNLTCMIMVDDGTINVSRNYSVDSIANSYPSVTSIRMNSTVVYTNDTLTCFVNATDPDNDALDINKFKWYNGTIYLENATNSSISVSSTNSTPSSLLSNNFSKYSNVTCMAEVSDGSKTNFSNVSVDYVANRWPDLPVIVVPADNEYFRDEPVTFNFSAFDIDNDTMTYYLFFNGTLNATFNSNTTNITFTHFAESKYNWTCNATDNLSGVQQNTTTRNFTVDRSDPALNITFPFGQYNIDPLATAITYEVFVNDSNLDTCMIAVIKTDTNGTEISNKTLDCISGTVNTSTFSVSTAESYYRFYLWANDSAGNENQTYKAFHVWHKTVPTGGYTGPAPPSPAIAEAPTVAITVVEPGDPTPMPSPPDSSIYPPSPNALDGNGDGDFTDYSDDYDGDGILNGNDETPWGEDVVTSPAEPTRVDSPIGGKGAGAAVKAIKYVEKLAQKITGFPIDSLTFVPPSKEDKTFATYDFATNLQMKSCELLDCEGECRVLEDPHYSRVIIYIDAEEENWLTKKIPFKVRFTNIWEGSEEREGMLRAWNLGWSIPTGKIGWKTNIPFLFKTDKHGNLVGVRIVSVGTIGGIVALAILLI